MQPSQRSPGKLPLRGPQKPPPQVETAKVDPAMFTRPASMVAAAQKEKDLMDNLEPIGVAPVPPPPVVEAKPPAPAPSQPESEPLDHMVLAVPDAVVDALAVKLGLAPPSKLYEETLPIGSGLAVSFRLPNYDDYLWALSVLERKIEAGEDLSLLTTNQQRDIYAKHLAYCRCLERVGDQWVWDLTGHRANLETHAASVGKSFTGPRDVPDFLRSVIAIRAHVIMRHLDQDALFTFAAAVDAHFLANREKALTEKKEDPTSAT